MRPGVLSWVETLFCGGVGVDLANEGEGAVEVGIPCDGTNSEEGRGGEGCARVGKRLASAKFRGDTRIRTDEDIPRTQRRRRKRRRQNGHAVGGVSASPGTTRVKKRTGRERAALKAVERAWGRPATFFRAPAGSLASILEESASRSSSTRIFERASSPASQGSRPPVPGESGVSARQITACAFATR